MVDEEGEYSTRLGEIGHGTAPRDGSMGWRGPRSRVGLGDIPGERVKGGGVVSSASPSGHIFPSVFVVPAAKVPSLLGQEQPAQECSLGVMEHNVCLLISDMAFHRVASEVSLSDWVFLQPPTPSYHPLCWYDHPQTSFAKTHTSQFSIPACLESVITLCNVTCQLLCSLCWARERNTSSV